MSDDWYQVSWGDARVKRRLYPEPLKLKEGEKVRVKFNEHEPRVVYFHGRRIPCIFVWARGQLWTLWLSHKNLANKVYAIYKEKGSLKDVVCDIRLVGKMRGIYIYDVILVEEEGEE